MIKNNKLRFILSSVVILIPMLFPLLGTAENILKTSFNSFYLIISPIMLLVHILLMIFEAKQQQKIPQNEKINKIIFWIVPIITLYISGIMLAISNGMEFSISFVMAPLLGIMFIVMGNYMPKSRQNRTFGIKIKWTLESEENWNATHRFAGKLWVILGCVILAAAFLPEMVFIFVFPVAITIAVVASIVYSYNYYVKHKEEVTESSSSLYSKNDKKAKTISIAVVSVILAFVSIISFTGKLNFTFKEEKMVVGVTFGGGTEIKYSDIESVEYIESKASGMRVSGFASSKLLYGWFRNDEYGNYLRYTYAQSDSYILIIMDGEEIVIADVDTDSTRALYDRLLEEMK